MADSRIRSNSFHSVGACGAVGPAPQAWPAARVIRSASGIKRTADPEGRNVQRKSRSPTALRHGSGAGMPTPVSEEQSSPQGSKGRERSRDRQPSASAQARANKSEEEEQLPRNPLAAIDRLEIAVAALDQASRQHFHTISKLDITYVKIQNRVNDMANQLSDAMI